MKDFKLNRCLCGERVEVFNIDYFWVVGCMNLDCSLFYKNSKFHYPEKEIAIDDWNKRIKILKEQNFNSTGASKE